MIRQVPLVEPARATNTFDVANGSKGDMAALKCDFRYAPTSGLNSDIGPCQKHAPSKESC